jgi:nicotinate-nucleotide adenylyltransferase
VNNQTKEKVGLFGGTFDPIHVGHLISAEFIRDILDLNEIIFIPAKNHPLKNNDSISLEKDRYQMVQLAIQDNSGFSLSDIELGLNKISYTIDTIKLFRERMPADSGIYFLMGMDNVNQIHKWKNPKILVKDCQIVAFGRPGFDINKKAKPYAEHIKIIQIPLIEISSSDIRARVRKNQTIRYLVPAKVEEYINENNLYKS